MKKIIAISGKQYSGKDTFAKILLTKMPDFTRVGLGDAIKIEYGKTHNLTFEQIEKDKHLYRSDLIELGNKGRAINPDYWLDNLSDMNNIIVPDIRMLHEVEYFKSQGAFVVRVDSSLEQRSKRGIITNINDNTEIQLDNYQDWNFVVNNDYDLNYLQQKADELIVAYLKFIS